jgi:hypothetical protein
MSKNGNKKVKPQKVKPQKAKQPRLSLLTVLGIDPQKADFTATYERHHSHNGGQS